MREAPVKTTGFRQGITSVSTTQKERLGTLRILEDGRKFRYSQTAAVITPGQATAAKAIVAAHITGAVGSFNTTRTQLTVTLLATGTAIALNGLVGGYLMVESGVGAGRSYRIASNTAATTASTSIIVTLHDRMAASDATTKVALVHSPYFNVIVGGAGLIPTGIAPVTLAIGDYYWSQTGGLANALIEGTPAVGAPVGLDATAGSLKVIVDTTASNAIVQVGQVFGTVGVDGAYKPVMLCLD